MFVSGRNDTPDHIQLDLLNEVARAESVGSGPKSVNDNWTSWSGKAPVRLCQCPPMCIWHLCARGSTDEQTVTPVVFRCPSKLSRTIRFNLLLTSTSNFREGTLTRILIRSMLLFGQRAIFPKAYVIEVSSSRVISLVKAPSVPHTRTFRCKSPGTSSLAAACCGSPRTRKVLLCGATTFHASGLWDPLSL